MHTHKLTRCLSPCNRILITNNNLWIRISRISNLNVKQLTIMALISPLNWKRTSHQSIIWILNLPISIILNHRKRKKLLKQWLKDLSSLLTIKFQHYHNSRIRPPLKTQNQCQRAAQSILVEITYRRQQISKPRWPQTNHKPHQWPLQTLLQTSHFSRKARIFSNSCRSRKWWAWQRQARWTWPRPWTQASLATNQAEQPNQIQTN